MSLAWTDIACLGSFPCIMAGGQFLFKITARPAKGRLPLAAMAIFIRQPCLYGALALYGAATLLWLWLLGRYSLTLAYPFTAIAFILIPLLESIFFKVRTTPLYWIGLALIVAGALVIARASGI